MALGAVNLKDGCFWWFFNQLWLKGLKDEAEQPHLKLGVWMGVCFLHIK